MQGAGAKVKVIPPEIEHFQIDFAAFEQALTPHTKGVVVNSPNNPSGVVYSRETLERLADRWVEAVEPELWIAGAENSSQGSIRQSPE